MILGVSKTSSSTFISEGALRLTAPFVLADHGSTCSVSFQVSATNYYKGKQIQYEAQLILGYVGSSASHEEPHIGMVCYK